jgi:hypothetical protein
MAKVKVIFGRSSKLVGLLIRFFDISPWSHVAIYDGGDWVYESVGMRYKGRLGRRKGVIKTHIDDFKARYSAWRIREVECYNSDPIGACEKMVSSKVKYDFKATIGALWILRVLRIHLGSPDAHNCSEMVNVITDSFPNKSGATVSDFWAIARRIE